MLERTDVPLADRAQVMMGAELFFDRGWPSNHFTVGMASQAGLGLIPPVYEGLGSEGRYFLTTMPSPPASELGCQFLIAA
jgi:hypothetical protein